MPKSLSTFIILLLLGFSGYAQLYSPAYAKKLKQELSMSTKDSTRVRLLYNLGEYYFINTEPSKQKGQFNEALGYFKNALALSERLKLKNQYNSYNIICKLGDIAYFGQEYKKGNEYYKKAIKFYITQKDLLRAGECYGKLAFTVAQIGNAEEALRYYKMSRSLYSKAASREKELDGIVKVAFTYFMLDKGDSAKTMFLKLINDNKKTNYKAVGFAYHGLATYYRYKANFNKALFYIFESYKWAIKTQDTNRLDMIYGEFAQIYQELGQTDNSIAYYKKSIALRNKKLLRQNYIFRTAGFLIQQLIKKNRQTEALKYIEKLERGYGRVGKAAKANIAQAKAYCYDALKQHSLAEQYYKDVVDYYANEDEELYDIALFDISKFYVTTRAYKKAAKYLSKIVADTANVQRIKDTQLLLYKVDSAEHNYLSALQHLLSYQSLNDSIFNATKNKQIEELNIKYQTDQQLKNILALQKETQLQRERVKQSDKIKNLILGGVIILLLLIAVLYHNYRLNKRNNIEISMKNQALNRLITEKEWLLKEVHHRVKNNLQIVMGLLQRQSAYINNEEALAAIQNSENRMHSIALIHQKLYQSENLDLISMPEYIEEMIGYLKDSCDVDNRILFEKHIEDIYLDVAQAVPLGLILNEAITNAIKYAYQPHQSGTIYITLVNNGECYNQLTIADDGPGLPGGFNIDKVESLGINLMRGLSKQLGGSFDIYSEQGCTINVVFKTEIFNRENGKT
ncbi:tetratricopeptide repeat-containing sensor histidine kinase [Mucilaginibacter sp. HD30]